MVWPGQCYPVSVGLEGATYARGRDSDKASITKDVNAEVREAVDFDSTGWELGQTSKRGLVCRTRVFAELVTADALKRSGSNVDGHISRDGADISAVVPVIVA